MASPDDDPRRTVAVVGGGITGLSTAWFLSRSSDPPRVVVLEADKRLGGKLLTSDFEGQPVDAGPDAFIARVPEGLDLCDQLGLKPKLISPATGQAYLWTRGHLRPLPAGLVLGTPGRLAPLARSGVLSWAAMARAGLDLILPGGRGGTQDRDRSVGEVVSSRFGREVAERLVDPLLGGIHAGSTDQLSVAATAPQLDAVRRGHRSLLLGLRELSEQTPLPPPGPLFCGLDGGMGEMVSALRSHLVKDGVELRTDTRVEGLQRDAEGWTVLTRDPSRKPLRSDAVVITTPADVAASLVQAVTPQASGELSGIPYASVAVVTLSYSDTAMTAAMSGSGFLVPKPDGRLMTACTWMSSKWPDLARPGQVLLRVSAGRFGDDRAMQLDDHELVEVIHSELVASMAMTRRPIAARVTRWMNALPQYQVGHPGRVERIEAALRAVPRLVLAGAALRGVGIPACIAQAQRAAEAMLAALGPSQP